MPRINPEYEKAQYEIGFIPTYYVTQPGFKAPRFNERIPDSVWQSTDKEALSKWLEEHAIPPVVD